MIRIRHLRGSLEKTPPIESNRARLVLGRDPDVDIIFMEDFVHGKHAEIVFQNGRYEITPPRDHSSASYNGIYLHTGSGEICLTGARPLRQSDRIYLGPSPGSPGFEVTFLFDRAQVPSLQSTSEGPSARPMILIAAICVVALFGLVIALFIASS